MGRIIHVEQKPKSKWRPLPMDTVEMEKLASRKLRIGAKETMQLAESLYTRGFISYPRTETNSFPPDLKLQPLVEAQIQDPRWSGESLCFTSHYSCAKTCLLLVCLRQIILIYPFSE